MNNNNNRFQAKTNVLSLFLAFILTTGTITAIFPSSLSSSLSFMTEVNAQSEYGLMDDYNSKYLPYDKDNNHYKSDTDKSVNLNKIKCINNNININGVNSGNISIGNKGQVEPSAASSFGNDGERYNGYSDGYINNKKDKGFDCVINNNNNNTSINLPAGIGDNQTIPPEPEPPTENSVYVVWRDNTPGNFDIFFALSNDNGQTFSTPINLSNNTGVSDTPQISTEGNNVYVVWQDTTTPTGFFDIFFALSNDNGQTFSTPINLSNNTGQSSNPQISTEGNNVYVVWEDNTPSNFDIFFAASTDNGQTFSTPPANISNNTGSSFISQISTEGNNVYVVWRQGTFPNQEIFFVASNNNGQTFTTPPVNLSNNTGQSANPQISSEGNNVYVVWEDNTPGNFEILFRASNNNGQTFTTPPDNISDNNEESFSPQITSEGNNVYVMWEEGPLGGRDIFFVASNDNGQTFTTPPNNISDNDEESFNPQISTEGNNVYIVWIDNTPGNFEILFRASNDNGQTFSMPAKNISNNTGISGNQQISTEGNNVYIVWFDSTPSNNEIFFAVSNDNGQTFSIPAKNISNNAGDSSGSKISSSTS